MTFLTTVLLVRPAFTSGFWSKTTGATTGASTSRPSKLGSTPLKSSENDAFEMSKSRRNKGDYNVTILSTRGPGGDGDGDSTDRIFEQGIVVNTFVDIESESIRHESSRWVNESDRPTNMIPAAQYQQARPQVD